MAKACWSIGLALVFGWAILTWSAIGQQPFAGTPSVSGLGSRDLITNFQPVDGGPTALTVIDPQSRVVAVYHISRETGEIQLKSVRNFSWDLQIEEFDSGNPLPKDIRAGLERVQ